MNGKSERLWETILVCSSHPALRISEVGFTHPRHLESGLNTVLQQRSLAGPLVAIDPFPSRHSSTSCSISIPEP